MFRKMSRPQQLLSQEECLDLLKQEPRGVLSVLGDDDYPYGLPLDFFYAPEDGKLYFHCGKTGHKLDALRRHDKASFCVMDKGYHKDGDWALTINSVIVFGRVEIIEDRERVVELTRRLSYKYIQDEAYIEDEISRFAPATLVLALTPEHICGKRVHES